MPGRPAYRIAYAGNIGYATGTSADRGRESEKNSVHYKRPICSFEGILALVKFGLQKVLPSVGCRPAI
jgi:hypothetical protein